MYYIYVALFGAFGAAARYWISMSLAAGAFPFNTLIINLTGCFLLAVTVRYLAELPRFPRNLVNGIGTGFIGSFTTFSAFSTEVSRMILQGEGFAAACYVFASIAGGFLAAALGFCISSLLIRRKELAENGN